MNTVYIYNAFHLGDNIFNFIFFSSIKKYLEENDITISYFAQVEYHDQLKEFIPSSNVILNDYYEEKGYHLWLGIYLEKYFNHNIFLKPFNQLITDMHNIFLQSINFSLKVDSLEYEDTDLLVRYDRLSESYKNIDILVVNSEPCSFQYYYSEEEWSNYIKKLKSKYKIVTTKKIEGINCTRDDNLTVKDIAALSTKVKVIIAINTGVVPALLNTYTLSNVKKIYLFDRCVDCFYYPKYPTIFEMKQKLVSQKIEDITLEELDSYIL
jgi:hypothetical protein